MNSKDPPKPTHVPGTHKGEEFVLKRGREPGRGQPGSNNYRAARDATSINAAARDPIDPKMPNMPPS